MAELIRRWGPLLGLVAVAALALWLQQPPRPLPASAPATEFAAGRTVSDLDSLCQAPHPIGTAAHDRVRRYLLRRLQGLGLRPRVQDTTVLLAGSAGPTLAHVQNVLARLPGTQPGGRAVLVLAHYDSQPHTPGAGDDAAGVAALLETIRALRAGPSLPHDVEWLFTDGEEAGLFGARAYAADTARLHRRIGLVLNVEGRGNSGPSLTFELSQHNGWLVREYARAAPYPIASSLFYEAYRYLPNDTDFTPLREAGLPGLNFAFIGGYSYYHSPADTPARLELASVQHHGSYLLALVRHFAAQPLPPPHEADYTFFNPLGTWLVRYPARFDQALLALAAVVLALAAALARPQRRLDLQSLVLGLLTWLAAAGLAVGVAAGLLAAIRALYPAYSAFYGGTFYNSLAYQVALLTIALTCLGCCYALLARRLAPDTLVSGALLAALALAAGLAWVAPSATYLLVWPLLTATLAWGWQLRRPALTCQALSLADWVLALPTVLLVAPTGHLLLQGFGLSTLVLTCPLLLAIAWGLLLSLLLPLLYRLPHSRAAVSSRQGRPAWALPGFGMLATLLALLWGHLTSQPTPSHPQQTQLAYTLNANTQQAWWTSALPHLDAWVQHALPRPQSNPTPNAAGPACWWQAAPVQSLAAPQAQVLADTVRAGRRYLRLLLQPGLPGATSLYLVLITPPASLRQLRLSGQPFDPAIFANSGLTLLPPSPAGTLLEADLLPSAPFRLRLAARAPGLPSAPSLISLPASYVPAPGFRSFTTQVQHEITL